MIEFRAGFPAALLLASVIATAPAAGQGLTTGETIGATGGRVIGAVTACKHDGPRILAATRELFARMNARPESRPGRATELFMAGMEVGTAEISSGRTSCRKALEALEELEHQLRRTR